MTRIWGVLAATNYRDREKKRGLRRAMSDQELVGEIRQLPQARLAHSLGQKFQGWKKTECSMPMRGNTCPDRSVMTGRGRCVLRMVERAAAGLPQLLAIARARDAGKLCRWTHPTDGLREDADSAEWNP